MRKIIPAPPLALCVLSALGIIGCSSNGQLSTGNLSVDQPAAQTQPPTERQNGIVEDWTTHQLVYPVVGPVNSMIALQHDPRAILSWQAAERDRRRRIAPRNLLFPGLVERDWSISLGLGTTAPTMYPAKYSFDVNALPDCTNDFVAFAVNVATGSGGTQPNIVGLNNLYSGPTIGMCDAPANGRTTGPSDTGVDATVDWGYNVVAEDGQVSTSPALSLDGQKVAFVETGSGTTAHFHVLGWAQFDGVNLSNLQDVTQPVTINAAFGFSPIAPPEGSGTATDLALVPPSGTASDTLSSPFVDYADDVAYVGNDGGTLFRVKNVFCIPVCTDGGIEAPSLDTSWPTATKTGSIQVCSGVLTGPVVDGGTGNIFVGCSDGKLYGFTSAGSALSGSPLTVGDGTTTAHGNVGGIVDPPEVDAVNGRVYAVSGSSGGSSVIVQAKTADLSSPVTAQLGVGATFPLHDPAFNTLYFSSGTSTDWLLYDWAVTSSGIAVYGVGFGAGHVMTSGGAGNVFAVPGSSQNELSPVTEFLNGTTDQLFVSGISSNNPNFVEYNIASGTPLANTFPTSFPPVDGSNGVGASTVEGSGTSGIVVDNDSPSQQASSIYFGVLGSNTAVKLTQSGLN